MKLGTHDLYYLDLEGNFVPHEDRRFLTRLGNVDSRRSTLPKTRSLRKLKFAKLCAKYGCSVSAVRSRRYKYNMSLRQALRHKPNSCVRSSPWHKSNMVASNTGQEAFGTSVTAQRRNKWRLDLTGE